MDLSKLTDDEIVNLYSQTIKELKARDIIRTKNVLGDLAEHLAVDIYCKTPGLPNLQKAPIGTQNIDAISRAGERYSIKATTGNGTGVFSGLQPKGSTEKDKQKFEYVIVCKFDNDYRLKLIYELTWDVFVKHKKWHSTMKAWNLSLSKDLLKECRIIYDSDM